MEEQNGCQYFIYSITNTKNGKVYIGRTQNPQKRFMAHKNLMIAGKHSCELLNEDCKTYGIENFDFEILKNVVGKKAASDMEFDFILSKKSYDSEFGYNYNDPAFWSNGKMTESLKFALKIPTNGLPRQKKENITCVDEDLLDEKIKESGRLISYLTQQLGLSRYGFYKKCKGQIPFRASEIYVLCDILKLSNEDKKKIFLST